MTITAVTPAADEPVSLVEARQQLSDPPTEDDAFIGQLIADARAYVENDTGQRLVTQTLEITLNGFPGAGRAIRLPVGPVSSIETISYTDTEGVQQAWSSVLYEYRGRHIRPLPHVSWPATSARWSSVTVRVVVGYGTPSEVPLPIRRAMLLLIGHWYLNREQYVTGPGFSEVPMPLSWLLGPYREVVV